MRLNILSRRTLNFFACWKEKNSCFFVARVSEIVILLKIFRCNAFLPQEFSSIQACYKNLDSPWKDCNKMILSIRISVLNRRKCQWGNLQWESDRCCLIWYLVTIKVPISSWFFISLYLLFVFYLFIFLQIEPSPNLL